MGTQETGKTLKVTALHHWGNGDCKKDLANGSHMGSKCDCCLCLCCRDSSAHFSKLYPIAEDKLN